MSNPGSETNYVNDYATIPVPLDQRRSSFSLAMVLVGSIICLSSIYVGASFVGQLYCLRSLPLVWSVMQFCLCLAAC